MKSPQNIVYLILQKVGSWMLLAVGFFLVLWVTFAAVEWPSSGPDGEIEGGIFAWLMKKVLENEDVSDSTNSGTVKYARDSDMVDGLHANELMASSMWWWPFSSPISKIHKHSVAGSCNSDEIEIKSEDMRGWLAVYELGSPIGTYFVGATCGILQFPGDVVLACWINTRTISYYSSSSSSYTRFIWRADQLEYNLSKVCFPKGMKIILWISSSASCPTDFQTFDNLADSYTKLHASKNGFVSNIGVSDLGSTYDTNTELRDASDPDTSLALLIGGKICTLNF